ncbi:hypothetical protein D477_012355 [Arthrobacter crystallopoietes BAB-32]|uniref:DUF2191 domain-containing protein n=1 Tax=Arthrobacter crystallopoietes BAB-32 TaxID=1246476 RepID=N1UXZ0_9MICC|nr:hypothetical protein [Arthrobacter crystallopoietes]EMY33920.1 hypothetical protein D477_012355 [Arthrobacter crystallopoietes BAB-32]
MAITSVDVDKAKIEAAKAILSAGSARETIDKSLEIVIALHNQQKVLEEMKAVPLTQEHRAASVVEYPDQEVV